MLARKGEPKDPQCGGLQSGGIQVVEFDFSEKGGGVNFLTPRDCLGPGDARGELTEKAGAT